MSRPLPLIGLVLLFATALADASVVTLDSVTTARIDSVLAQYPPRPHELPGQRIAQISAQFLGVPYQARMLEGSPVSAEKLVIDFRAVDCFTYLDYVEALRRSSSENGFVQNLIRTRYKDGRVDYFDRKHFFTDWAVLRPVNARDVTRSLGASVVTEDKLLNRKADGSLFIPALGVTSRAVSYIPGTAVNQAVLAQLRDGDYIGIYTPTPGLDVTHAGIFVKTAQGPVFRNASLRIANHKVVDYPFMEYVKSVPGIVVLRAEGNGTTM